MRYKKILFVLIVASWGLLGPIVREVGFPSPVTACLRAWLSGMTLILYLALRRVRIDWGEMKKSLLPVLLCGVLMACDWIGLFEAYNYTTIATATVCYYMTPIFVFLAAPIVFQEPFGRKHLLCACLSLVGMICVSGVIGTSLPAMSEIKGILFALEGACAYTAIVLLNRKYPQGDAVLRTAIELLMAGVITTPYILLNGQTRNLQFTVKGAVLLVLLSVVLTSVTYVQYFRLLNELPTRTISILSYSDPLAAVLLSVFVLGEPLTLLTAVGSVLILGSAAASELQESHP